MVLSALALALQPLSQCSPSFFPLPVALLIEHWWYVFGKKCGGEIVTVL